VFAVQPNGMSVTDVDQGILFNPRTLSDTVCVTAYHVKRASAGDAYVTFQLRLNASGSRSATARTWNARRRWARAVKEAHR